MTHLSRRGFLGGLAALVGGIVLEQAVPLGRVWSFPSKIRTSTVSVTVYDELSAVTNRFIIPRWETFSSKTAPSSCGCGSRESRRSLLAENKQPFYVDFTPVPE